MQYTCSNCQAITDKRITKKNPCVCGHAGSLYDSIGDTDGIGEHEQGLSDAMGYDELCNEE